MNDQLELWLVRHGETVRSAEGRIAGWTDTVLTELGRDEAVALRGSLEKKTFDGVWCSDLSRAAETAELAWGEATPSELLREIGFGSLEGARWQELDPEAGASLSEFRNFRAPGGESLVETRARLDEFISRLSPGRHLLFVHGGVIRLLTADLGLDRFVATGSLIVVDWCRRELLTVQEREGGPDIDPGTE